jgi:hypothetical protein
MPEPDPAREARIAETQRQLRAATDKIAADLAAAAAAKARK